MINIILLLAQSEPSAIATARLHTSIMISMILWNLSDTKSLGPLSLLCIIRILCHHVPLKGFCVNKVPLYISAQEMKNLSH